MPVSLSGSLLLTGSLTTTGQIVAQSLNVQQVTSSIVYSSGSNTFGNQLSNVQAFTGSLRVTGSGNHWIVGGNVGIGTASPTYLLDVFTSATTGTTGMFRISRALGYGQTLFEQIYDSTFFSNGKTLTLKNDSNIAFAHFAGNNAGTITNFLLPSGSIGIGTNSPIDKIQIDSPNSQLRLRDSDDGTFTQFSSSGNLLAIRQNSTTESHFWMNSSGSVGLGTNSPALKGHIVGTAGLPASSGTTQLGALRLQTGASAASLDMGVSGSTGAWLQVTNVNDLSLEYPLILNPNGGNLLVGTTTDAVYKLDVNGTGRFINDVTISSTGTAKLKITADTDNVTETDIAAIELSQDNGTSTSYFGLNSTNDLVIGVNSTNSPSIYIGTRNDGTNFVTESDAKVTILNGGNVGIGTKLPSGKLEVNVGSSAAYFTRTAGDNGALAPTLGILTSISGTRIYSYGDTLQFWTAAVGGTVSVKMTLDSSGSLGLGVTPSAWGSSFKSLDINTNGASVFSSGTADARIYANAFFNGTSWIYKGGSFASGYQQGNSEHRWFIAPSGIAGDPISFTQAMTLDASGNLGLGIASPVTTLDIRSTLDSTGYTTAANLSTGANLSLYQILNVNTTTDANGEAGILLSHTFSNSAQWGISVKRTGSFIGDLIFRTRTGNTTSAERMRIFSSGNVFIGSSPSDAGFKLDVSGSGRFNTNLELSNGTLFISSGSGTNYSTRLSTVYTFPYVDTYLDSYAGTSYQGRLQFRTNSEGGALSTKLIIENSGNVGIGTTSPTYRTEISLAASNYWNGTAFTGTPTALAINSTANGGYDPVLIFQQTDSGGTLKNAGAIGLVGTNPWTAGSNGTQISDMYFLVRNNSGGISERMRITSSGSVGIGTSNPSYKLDVASTTEADIRLNSAVNQDSNLRFAEAGTNKWVLYNDSSADSFKIYDSTALADRFTISGSGNVGIGTASPNLSAGSSGTTVLTVSATSSGRNGLLELNGTRTTSGDYVGYVRFFNNAASTPLADIQAIRGSSDTTGSLAFATNNIERMRLNSEGELTIGYGTTDNGAYLLQVNSQIFATNATIATSDERLKENVQDMGSTIEIVTMMRPRTFTYKQDTRFNFNDSGVTTGFIAQELKETLASTPYSGSVVPLAGEYYGVAYEKLIPILTKAIQEQQVQIATLRQEINELKLK